MKRYLACLMILLSIIPFGACWDYRGLNEQTIVVGMAVDIRENGNYHIAFEVLDLNAFDGGALTSVLLETEAESLVEAMHALPVLLHNNVYFGAMDVLILGIEFVQRHGIEALVLHLSRDPHMRNSMHVVVSDLEWAADLLRPLEDETWHSDAILSKTLAENLSQSERGGQAGVQAKALFEVFDALQTGGETFVVPIITASEARDIPFARNGLAVFYENELVGEILEADMPYYLLATSTVRDKVLVLEIEYERVAVRVRQSEPSVRARQAEDSLRFYLDLSLQVEILSPPSYGQAAELTRKIEIALEQELTNFIQKTQETGLDVLGFSTYLRRYHPNIWEQKAGTWERYFESGEVDVRVQAKVQNFGVLRPDF